MPSAEKLRLVDSVKNRSPRVLFENPITSSVLILFSIGTGLTTFHGMLDYMPYLMALILTVSLHAVILALVLSLWVLKALRTFAVFWIILGYFVFVSISIFFSFNLFYQNVDTKAAQRQSSGLHLRLHWAQIFAKIREAETQSLTTAANGVVGTNNFAEFKAQFERKQNNLSSGLAQIDAVIGAKLAEVVRSEEQLNALIARIDAVEQGLHKNLDLIQARIDELAEEREKIVSIVPDEVLPTPEAEIEARIANDLLIKTEREVLLKLETEFSELQRILAAKLKQAEAELNTGGTVNPETGEPTPAGAGPRYRLYVDEATVIEVKLNLNIATIEQSRNRIANLSQAIRDAARAEFKVRQSEAEGNEAVKAEKLATIDALIEGAREEFNAIIARLAETNAQRAAAERDIATLDPETAGLRVLIRTVNHHLAAAQEINLPTQITSIADSLGMVERIDKAQSLCRTMTEIAGTIYDLVQANEDQFGSIQRVKITPCPAIVRIDLEERGLDEQASRLALFSDECQPAQLPRPPTEQNLLINSFVEATSLIRLKNILGVDSNGSITRIQPLSAADRDFVERLKYEADYAAINDRILYCLALINTQNNAVVIGAQLDITRVLDHYNPKAHAFTRTIAALQRGSTQAWLALIQAFVMDCLLISIGFLGRLLPAHMRP